MNGKYAELSDFEYAKKFFGYIEKEEAEEEAIQENEYKKNDNYDNDDNVMKEENKNFNDLFEMEKEIYQFIYKGINMKDNGHIL